VRKQTAHHTTARALKLECKRMHKSAQTYIHTDRQTGSQAVRQSIKAQVQESTHNSTNVEKAGRASTRTLRVSLDTPT
jgi:hypothetical protein